MVKACHMSGVVDSFTVSPHNEGQHPPTNRAIARAIAEGYDYLLRVDDDVEWITKRWLAKLVEAAVALGDDKVISPMVKGLRWQPPQFNEVEIEKIPVKFVEGPLGGICRLTSVKLLKEKPYVSDVRLPMGGGDAGGVGAWAMNVVPITFLAYCQHIRVRHAKSTDTQVHDDPRHFEDHALYQHMPYIPVWRHDST
jgi:glycosyltransferase involved in cell wall biosynthesis